MTRRLHRVDPTLLNLARRMRTEPAPAEQKLWACLRDRQLGGFKFRRQHAVGPYVADFCCTHLKLIVELDGDSHEQRQKHDSHRTALLNSRGFEVIRFPNTDVFDNLEGVLIRILEVCCSREQRTSSPSSPPYAGERPGEGPMTRNESRSQ